MRIGGRHLRQPLYPPATQGELHCRSGTSRNATDRELSFPNYLGGISATGFSLGCGRFDDTAHSRVRRFSPESSP